MPSYTYIYFNVRGRGEVARYIFALAGVKYEDSRIEEGSSEWYAVKSDMPFEQVPVLEVDGTKIAQGIAIARYLAKETGIAGKTNLEQALVDSVVDQATDMREKAIPIFDEEDEEKKKKMAQEFVTTAAPKFLRPLEKFLSANSGGDGYFVGDSMSFADLNFYAVVEVVHDLVGDVLKDYPKLRSLYERVGENPNIAAYIKGRPETII